MKVRKMIQQLLWKHQEDCLSMAEKEVLRYHSFGMQKLVGGDEFVLTEYVGSNDYEHFITVLRKYGVKSLIDVSGWTGEVERIAEMIDLGCTVKSSRTLRWEIMPGLCEKKKGLEIRL